MQILVMKLSEYFTTVTPISKIIAMILFVTLPFIGFYLGYKSKFIIPNEEKLVTNSTINRKVLQTGSDVKQQKYKIGSWSNTEGRSIFVVSDHLGVEFPENLQMAISEGTLFSYNNSRFLFTINGNPGGGVCDLETTDCSYTDEELPNISTLRIWEKQSKVVGINPQDISNDYGYVNNIVITKLTPSEFFTQKEVDVWKNILSNIVKLD